MFSRQAGTLKVNDHFMVQNSQNVYRVVVVDGLHRLVKGFIFCRHTEDAAETVEVDFDSTVNCLTERNQGEHSPHPGRVRY